MRVPDQQRRCALRGGGRPGAGRQDARNPRPLPAALAHLLRRSARPAQLRPARPGRAGRTDRRGSGVCEDPHPAVHRTGGDGAARRRGCDVLHLRHHRQPQGRGAHPQHADRPRRRGRPVRQADRKRRGAGLPAARVDRAEHLQLCAVAGGGLRGELPGIGRHRDHRPERSRPDVLLRTAARVRGPAHHRDDPHGRRGHAKTQNVPRLHGRGAPRRPDQDGRQVHRLHGRPQVRAGQPLCVRPVAQQPGPVPRACGLHGRRSHRSRSVQLLPLHRHQPQAALRLHRDRRVRLPAARPRSARRHRGRALRGCGDQAQRHRRDPGEVARPAQGVLQEPGGHGRGAQRRRLVPHQRRGLHRRLGPPEDHRPRERRRPHQGRRQRRRHVRAQVRGEQAQVLLADQGSRGLWRPARPGLRDGQHRLRGRGQLGRAPQPALRRLHRPGPEARGVRADPRVRGKGQRRPEPRRTAGRQPDQPLPGAAQGTGRRRRRTDPHQQGPPRLHRRQIQRADRRPVQRQDRAVHRNPGEV